MDRMMDGMGGMMWGAGLLWLLLAIILVLAAAALIKYLRSDRTR
jgi:tellurite resistance protein TehA-like permease